jgi:hypothetical protein
MRQLVYLIIFVLLHLGVTSMTIIIKAHSIVRDAFKMIISCQCVRLHSPACLIGICYVKLSTRADGLSSTPVQRRDMMGATEVQLHCSVCGYLLTKRRNHNQLRSPTTPTP